MTDSIINCTKFVNSDGSVDRYDIQFAFDGLYAPTDAGWVTTVFGFEMKDTSDMNELKAAAIVKGVVLKAYAVSMSLPGTSISNINGPVTW